MTVRSAIRAALSVWLVAGTCAMAMAASGQATAWSEQKLVANGNNGPEYFGYSLAVSGATALVGAAQATVNGNAHQGAVYVFHEANGVWAQTQKLTASDGAAGDEFGASVALWGTTALIGAYGAAVNGQFDQGAAYVFHEASGSWQQTQKLTAVAGAAGDEFGVSVALSGPVALVGAPVALGSPVTVDGAQIDNPQGAVYVFDDSSGTWQPRQRIMSSDNVLSGDNFGFSLALSGNTALVGAPDANAAYVLALRDGSWTEQYKLTPADGAPGDGFGAAVALAGATALIGAPQATVAGHLYQGVAYVFSDHEGGWSQGTKLSAQDGATGDLFGLSVALAGTTAIVGAPLAVIDGHEDQGAAYVFDSAGGPWVQTQKLTASDDAVGERFGVPLALSGTTALIGAVPAVVAGTAYQGAVYAAAAPPPPPPPPPPSPPANSGGGGSLGWLALTGLLGLALGSLWVRKGVNGANCREARRLPAEAVVNPRASRRQSSRRGVILIALCAALLIPIASRGAGLSPAPETTLRRAIHADLVSYLRTRGAVEHVSAVSVSISLHGNPANLNVTAGTLRYGGNQPVTPASMFQVGSNTKSFTATMLLQLAAEGKLSLDDTLGQWLPQYPQWSAITIRQLLNMTSGIYDYDQSPQFFRDLVSHPYTDFTAAELIAYAADEPIQPVWYYSNTAYILAQLIIEKATGDSYTDEIHQRIINPLGLAHTFYNGGVTPKDILAQMCAGYFFSTYSSSAPLRPYYGKDISGLTLSTGMGAGGVISTPEDITHWVRALYQGGILQAAQRKQLESLVSRKSPNGGYPISQTCGTNSTCPKDPGGFGLGVGQLYLAAPMPYAGPVWFYEGETLGYRMLYVYFPKTDTVIAVGLNSLPDHDRISSLLFSIYAILKSEHAV